MAIKYASISHIFPYQKHLEDDNTCTVHEEENDEAACGPRLFVLEFCWAQPCSVVPGCPGTAPKLKVSTCRYTCKLSKARQDTAAQ